ncbi:MAG: Adenylosuccinate synthetase, partial [uncultured Rubrobacteraceae bacterium]
DGHGRARVGMGRRGEGAGLRRAGLRRPLCLAVFRWQQRRAHRPRRRGGVQAPPHPVWHRARGRRLHHRQRGRGEPGGARRGGRGARGARDQRQGPAQDRRPGPPHNALPHSPRFAPRDRFGRRAHRDDQQGHRPRLRGQGGPLRSPRAGHLGRGHPQDKAQGGAAREELDLRERLRREALRRLRARHLAARLRGIYPADALRHGHHAARGPRAAGEGPARGGPGYPPGQRPRHLPVRDVLQPDRRGGRHGLGHPGRAARVRCRGDEGLHDAGRGRADADRALRRGGGKDPGGRRRVRDDDGEGQAGRVARPSGHKVGRFPERHHALCADDARRALVGRRGQDLYRLRGGRGAVRGLPDAPDGPAPRPPRLQDAARVGRGHHGVQDAGGPARGGAGLCGVRGGRGWGAFVHDQRRPRAGPGHRGEDRYL